MSGKGECSTLEREDGTTVFEAARWASATLGVVTLVLASSCSGGSGGLDSPEVPGEETTELSVTPDDVLVATGVVGGPFSPDSIVYTLTNGGATALPWSAGSDQAWIALSSSAGNLAAGASVDLEVTIDQASAAGLGAGVHTGMVTITDDATGADVTRSVTLQISTAAMTRLEVTTANPLSASGPQGGPFAPSSTDYQLTNNGSTTMAWSASADMTWVVLSKTSGSLLAGESTTVTVSIDQTQAAALGLGAHTTSLTFSDDDLAESTTRSVMLQVNAIPGVQSFASSLTQFGITWQFDKSYSVGQFANGDWWVVGPVTITKITPESVPSNGRTMNGSMVNPSPRLGQTQGYDNKMYAQYRVAGNYNPEVNAALNVSASNPLVLQAHSSLVSTISETAPDVRPQIRTAAILTVLATEAPAGSFRPPYCGTDKSIQFNEADLDYGLLASLAPVGPMVSLSEAERMFERPWIDHVPLWIGRYIHPSQNMPDYGREISDNVGVGAILLHMNFTNAQKRTLLVRFVQLGIDLYGITQDGGEHNWPPSAGHMSGRKWPILFAGLVLGDPAMSGVGFDKTIEFGEDGQCFYVEETSPGVYNYGFGGYEAGDVGMPDWGTSHSYKPSYDDKNWNGDPYRQCCTANAWWGQLLAAHVMGAVPLWDHDPLFDYQDRYLVEMRARGTEDWRLAWRDFYLDLWDEYRDDY